MESRKVVFHETLIILIGQLICIAVMFGVYWLMKLLTLKVLLGGLLGTLLTVANFFFMAVTVSLATDKAQQEDVKGGQKLMHSSQLLRNMLLFVVLIAAGASGYFDIIALALPLLFVRPIITVAEFFRKKGE